MFENATARSFEPYLDHVIRTRLGEQEIELRLIEIRSHGEGSTRPATLTAGNGKIPRREPFSLIFKGPREPLLPDDTYAFSHSDLRHFALFVSGFRQDGNGIYYESVFT